MRKPDPTTKGSCYGCIHLKYKGPAGILPESEAPADDGTYICRMFQEPRSAKRTPMQIIPNCKETRP